MMPFTKRPTRFVPGQRVRVLTKDGELKNGVTVVRCGLLDEFSQPVGDWFVDVDGGERVHVFENEMEREQ